MSLVESLLGAIIRLDGTSLVLHTGEKPYVVTSSKALNAYRGPLEWGQVEISTRLLTTEAVLTMLDQMLTSEQRRLLDELGAVENELPGTADRPPFTVIAARGGDDIFAEIRPVRPVRVAEPIPQAEAAAPAVEPPRDVAAVAPANAVRQAEQPAPRMPQAVAVERPTPVRAEPVAAAQTIAFPHPVSPTVGPAEPITTEVPPHIAEAPGRPGAPPPFIPAEALHAIAASRATPEGVDTPLASDVGSVASLPRDEAPASAVAGQAQAASPVDERTPEFVAAESEELASVLDAREPDTSTHAAPEPALASIAADAPALEIVPEVEQEQPDEAEVTQLLASSGLLSGRSSGVLVRSDEDAPRDAVAARVAADTEEIDLEVEPPAAPAVVVPLARAVRQAPEPQPPAPATAPAIERLLRVAAARGASGLYLVARSQPTLRVDGEMQRLESDEALSASDVEALMLALAPEPTRDAVRSGETSEWFRDVPEIGRVRCLSFRDHRGPGVIVRMLPARAISVEQLGLSKDIQALCGQPDGLVLVAGPRASGKSTLMAAFVDLINRTRADHVITIERQITFVHENRRSFLSQREVRGEAHDVLGAVRSALREDPDVLVVEELRSPDVIAAALDAAETGRLVLAGFRAPGAGAAIERLVDQIPAERRAQALAALSTSLRAVLAQVLLRKRGGGSVAARELLLNTPAAASVIAEGKLFQLSAALESGRKLGSMPLNDALASLIRDGVVDAGEAWRKAHDREGLLAVLKREGIDTSFVERLA